MPAPREIDPSLLPAFTLRGAVAVESWYFDDTQPTVGRHIYQRADIDAMVKKVRAGEFSYYGQTDGWLYQALEKFPIRGKNVVVMGSTIPWYESIVLAYGGHCTVIEYNSIHCDHPDIEYLTWPQFEAARRQFDAAFSISSFEHDGLGRYGDPINPDGDLAAMGKMKDVLKPGGLLYLAVPVGRDKLVWNAHRIYGRKRLPLLIKDWRLVRKFGFSLLKQLKNTGISGGYQPVLVLANESN